MDESIEMNRRPVRDVRRPGVRVHSDRNLLFEGVADRAWRLYRVQTEPVALPHRGALVPRTSVDVHLSGIIYII